MHTAAAPFSVICLFHFTSSVDWHEENQDNWGFHDDFNLKLTGCATQ